MTHTARPRSHPLHRALRGLVIMALALYLGGLQAAGNSHKVIAGERYRSAQPDPAALARWQGRYGIRSIVNLRGANPGKGRYDAEIAISEALFFIPDPRLYMSRPAITFETAALCRNLLDAFVLLAFIPLVELVDELKSALGWSRFMLW